MAYFNLLWCSCTYLLGHCEIAAQCCLLLNGFYISMLKWRRWWKRNTRRVEIKLHTSPTIRREKRVARSRRGVQSVPARSTILHAALQLQNGHSREKKRVFNVRVGTTATAAASKQREMLFNFTFNAKYGNTKNEMETVKKYAEKRLSELSCWLLLRVLLLWKERGGEGRRRGWGGGSREGSEILVLS